MTNFQQDELESFDYFVKYIKKLIYNNPKKYGLKAVGKIKYTSNPRFNSKQKCWDLFFSSSKTEKVFINKINGLNPIYEDLTSNNAIAFKNKYRDFAEKIINSSLNSYFANIKEIKKDFVRHIENKTEYSVYESSILGVFLRSNAVEIKFKNLADKPATIELLPVKIDEIENLLYTTQVSPFNLAYYGLKVKFKLDKSIGNSSYYEQEEEYLLSTILKLLFVVNTTVLTWKVYTEPKECSLWGYLGNVPIYQIPFRKILTKTDVNLLLKYYKEFRQYLIKHSIFNNLVYDKNSKKYISNDKNLKAISAYSVAIEYYNEALHIPLDKPNKIIATVIMGLEALYTTPDCDLAYTLRMRITTLFKILDNTQTDILNIIKKGYDVRCDYAHGGTKREGKWQNLLNMGKFNDTEECIYYFLNILRISIIVALILENDNLKIKGFQELIDNIMIGEFEPKIYLKQKLNPYKKIFKF